MPFGQYKDFASCVTANQDKDNPESYCAQIHKDITGKWPSEKEKMKTKETDDFTPVFPLQTGDKINKAGKDGEVIQVSPDQDVLVMWKDGKMSQEKPNSLKKVNESVFSTYLKNEKRI